MSSVSQINVRGSIYNPVTISRRQRTDPTTYPTLTLASNRMDSTRDLPFRFLALPQEVRDYIYDEILTTTYTVDLPQPWVYLRARQHGQFPPSPHCASSHLAILRVSKSVYHEVEQILFGLSTFGFRFPSTGLPLGHDLTKRSAATLMQNIFIQLDMLTSSPQSNDTTLQSTTSILRFSGGAIIPRTNCIIQVQFDVFSDFLLEASFLDALGKLTGFKTVIVELMLINGSVGRLKSSTYRTLDEYLSVMLGAGEAEELDEDGYYRMTYHPRGRTACTDAGLW